MLQRGMIKSELILRVAAENPHLSEADIEQVVNRISFVVVVVPR